MNREIKNTKGRKKHTGLKIGVVVAVIVIIILLLLHFCKGCSAGDPAGRVFDLTRPGDAVSDRGPDTRSEEEIQADLNTQVEEGMITMSMNLEPSFERGNSEGDLLIANDAANRHPQIVEIVREDNGETIYTSPVIPVGKYINSDELDADLSAGDYPCVAYFHAVDESGAVLGTGAVRITVHIHR